MEHQEVDSKVSELASKTSEAGLSGEDKQPPVPLKKTPLRELRSENNILPPKGSIDSVVQKEVVTAEPAKVSGAKRPSPDSPMSPPQQSSSNSGANGHLVYVRRKSEAETGKNCNNEALTDNANSPSPSRQHVHQEDGLRPKSLISESQMQPLPAYAPIPGSVVTIPPGKPSIPVAIGNCNAKTPCVDPNPQAVPSVSNSPTEARGKKQNWEDRYIQLQMYLKTLDQSNLDDHLQLLRTLSAVELSRHAVELEMRAIQLSLEQGKEMQRVKALNVLGKAMRNSN